MHSPDRRAHPRQSVNLPARVFWGKTLEIWADCTVIDISPGGAKIALPEVYDPPVYVVLLRFDTGVAHEAVRKWRRRGALGMAFEEVHQLSGPVKPTLLAVQAVWKALGPAATSGEEA